MSSSPSQRDDDSNQQQLVELLGEIRLLKATIAAQREQAEQVELAHDSALQEAASHAAQAQGQLQETVVALRQALDEQRLQHEAELQQQRLLAADERQELQDTIRTLRQRIELLEGSSKP